MHNGGKEFSLVASPIQDLVRILATVKPTVDREIMMILGSIPIKSTRHPKRGAPGKIDLTEGNANKAVRQIEIISESFMMCHLLRPDGME